MNWISENLVESILTFGILLLIIEVLILGFSTFFLFFAGLAAIATALSIWLGVIPESLLTSLIVFSVLTTIFAVALYKPMKKIQTKVEPQKAKSDLVGHQFVLSDDINTDENKPVHYQFSGVEWRLRSTSSLSKGTTVEIYQIEVGVLWVRQKDTNN